MDIVHEEAVDELACRFLVDVGGEQIGVARLRATVAAHVDVPALLGRDDPEVLALRLGALADAARHRRLRLVRRADAAVALLKPDGERGRVLHAVAAPGRADAALHRPHRLAVGVAALEAGVDERLPDVGQLLGARAEQVDPLPTRDLAVEVEALRHFAEDDQLLGRDLAARDARHDRVGTAALDVGEEAVVGVLDGRMVQDEVVPRARQDRSHRRSAHLAAAAGAVAREERVEALHAPELHDLEQLLAREGEVLAQVAVHFAAGGGEPGLEQLRHQRDAAAAARARLGARLDAADSRQLPGVDGAPDVALAHVVAGADLRVVGERRGRLRAPARAEEQLVRTGRHLVPVAQRADEHRIRLGVADEDTADEPPAVLAHDELLVDAAHASSSRGRMPAETTTMSTTRSSPAAKRRPVTASVPRIACVCIPVWTCTPSAAIFRRSTSPPAASTWRGMSRGANSTTCTSRPRSWTAFAASRPRSPPPMTAARRARALQARIASKSSIVR